MSTKKLSETVEIVPHPIHPADEVYDGLKSGKIKETDYAIFDGVEIFWMVFVDSCPIKLSLNLYGVDCTFGVTKCSFDIALVADICKEFRKWQFNKTLEVMTKDYVLHSAHELLPRIQSVVSKYDDQPKLDTAVWQ